METNQLSNNDLDIESLSTSSYTNRYGFNTSQQQAISISRSARIRWHLAIMLIQNPSLRKYRGHFLRSHMIKLKHIAKALYFNPVLTTVAGGFEIGRLDDDDHHYHDKKQGTFYFIFFYFVVLKI